MSRLKNLSRSLLSGYLLMIVNIVFTMATFPLARQFLVKDEFGLWVVITTIGGYLLQLDMGMSGAVSRILIDHKDDKKSGHYGSVIKTAFLVFSCQGLLAAGVGIALSFFAGKQLNVTPELMPVFQNLLIGQAILLFINFALRTFGLLLYAHQRQDLPNLAGIVCFIVQFAFLWFFFHQGKKLYSLLYSMAISQLLSVAFSIYWSSRLHLWPAKNAWGHATWSRFKELFAFSRDMFLYQLGLQLINGSQALLITKTLGLEAAAVWGIGSKAFNMISQAVNRIFDSSCSVIAEMIVRKETALLHSRVRSLVVFSASLAILAGAGLAYGNEAFVKIWMGKDYGWPVWNDVLLGIWLFFCVVTRILNGLAGLSKNFGAVPYIFFLEGAVFCGITFLILPVWGISGMLLVSIICTACISYSFGIWRTARYFNESFRTILGWMKPSMHLAIVFSSITGIFWLFFHNRTPLIQLIFGGSILSVFSVWSFLRFGIDSWGRSEIIKKLPFLKLLFGKTK